MTVADLLLKFAQALMGRLDSHKLKRRDQVDRVANYLDSISTCLTEAAKNFEKNEDAWEQIGEVEQHLRSLLTIAAPVLGDDETVLLLSQALRRSYVEDCIIDSHLTTLATRRQLPATEGHGYLSEAELEQRILVEIRKIKQTAGLFRAVASQLRAKPS